MNIKAKLNSINSLADFKELIESAEPGVTFWGYRYIHIPFQGHAERAPIELLIQRVRDFAVEKNFTYSPEERTAGQAIVKHINRLYQRSDTVLNKACLITRILCCIKEFFKEREERRMYFATERSLWVTWHPFEYYLFEEFQRLYGVSPEEKKVKDTVDVVYDPPKRYRMRPRYHAEPSLDPKGNLV